jgi:HD-like signal output (HDOD) protein
MSRRATAAENLLAILKMAEHICASYRVLGNQTEDHEWNSIGHWYSITSACRTTTSKPSSRRFATLALIAEFSSYSSFA